MHTLVHRVRNRRLFRLLSPTLAAFLAAGALAGESVPATRDSAVPPAVTSVELEEVQVIGRKLLNLQLEIVATQDRFYTLYNDLNENDDFDVFCRYEARTGTQVRKWECKVAFIQEALAHQSQEMFRGWTEASANGRRYVDTPSEQWAARRAEYIANVRAVSLASPELRELAIKWEQLQESYDRQLGKKR